MAAEIDRLTELPLRIVARSFAQYQRQSLSQEDAAIGPVLLGQKTRRNSFGFSKGQYQFILMPNRSEFETVPITFSLEDYLQKHSGEAGFLKQNIARLVLHNAFDSGLKTVYSSDVRVAYGSDGKTVSVYLVPLGSREAHPLDSTERFLTAVAQLPLGELRSTPLPQLLESFQNRETKTKESITDFLAEPENLRWAMQMIQLQQSVGADVFQHELRLHLLKNPKLLITFFKKRWFPGALNNRCRVFYR